MGMSPAPPARRLRLGLPRRVFSQVLLMQVAIAAGVAVLATGLFLAPLSAQLDDQAMRRALAIAQTTAAEPQIAEDDLTTPPGATGPVQRGGRADPEGHPRRVRRGDGPAWRALVAHRRPTEIGQPRLDRPAARPWPARTSWRSTTAPWAAPRAARCRCATRRHGSSARSRSASRYDSVRAGCSDAIPGLFAYAGGALAVGALAAWLDLPPGPAADPRPGLLRHLGAARGARGDAARHPGGRRRPGPRRPRPPAQRRGAAAAGHRRRGRRPLP